MIAVRFSKSLIIITSLVWMGCGLLDDSATKKPSNSGLIATPVTYYSTSRARYLGAKYKENLDRLVERIVRNPKTANLQFANNIASVGGIGFFTHSATKTADERYLEVVLAAPETFETKGAHNDKFNRLFALYGADLLGTLSSDNEVYQDKELTGYALNLSWRNVIPEQAGNRVALERAIVYLPKEKSRKFLRREINQQDLLEDATIFAVEEDGPLNLISYRPPQVHEEYRPMIREDDLSLAPSAAKPVQSPAMVKTETLDQVRKDALPSKEPPPAKAAPPKTPVTVAQKNKPLPPKVPGVSEIPVKSALPGTITVEPTEIPAGEVVPAELGKFEGAAPLDPRVSETPKIAPITKPVAKNAEPARAMNSPKPQVESKITPESPADFTPPPVVATGLAKNDAQQAMVLSPGETAASSQLVDPAKAIPRELKPFLPPEPLAPTSVPAPEPIVEKSVPTMAVVERPANSAEIVRAPANVPPARPTQPIEAPLEPGTPSTVGKAESLAVIAAPTPRERSDAKPREIASAPPAFVKSTSAELPVVSPVFVSAPPVVSNKPPVSEAPVSPVTTTSKPVVDKTPTKPALEQLASLPNKPIEAAPARPLVTRPAAPKPLEGFIIQLAFNDKERAQRWAEGMEKKGFAVSVTEAGSEGALRVRLGNFVLRDDAERQLKAIKQEGLSGIILNLPQAFRPEARTSIP